MAAEPDPVVYFVYSPRNNLVKIGWTRRPIRVRLQSMQVGSAEQLVLLGIIAGDGDTEKEFHAELAAYRVHGEWFKMEPPVTAFVQAKIGGSVLASPNEIAEIRARIFALRPGMRYELGRSWRSYNSPLRFVSTSAIPKSLMRKANAMVRSFERDPRNRGPTGCAPPGQ